MAEKFDLSWIDNLKETKNYDKIIEFLDEGLETYNTEMTDLIALINTGDTEKDKKFIIEIMETDIKLVYNNIMKILEYIKQNKKSPIEIV